MNLYLLGGSTLFPGMIERLHNELNSQICFKKKIKIIADKDRIFSVWKGGAILSSLTPMNLMWITRDEYYDFGKNVVNLKCF